MKNTPKTPMRFFIGVPLEELPTTNPPVAYEDLRWSERQDEELFTLPDMVAEDPTLMPLWVALVEAAKSISNVKVKGQTVCRVFDADLLAHRIEEAQHCYYEERDRFWAVVNGREANTFSYYFDTYIKRENIEYDPEFNAESNA